MSLPVLLGFDAVEPSILVGAVGGAVTAVVVLAAVGLALAPEVSSAWAERLGVAEEHRGPDPAEVVPGREEFPAAGEDAATDADAPAVAADAAE